MGFGHFSSQASATRIIKRWGGAGKIVRAGVQRPAFMAILDYKPTQRALFLEGSRQILVAAAGLSVGPDHELDTLLFKGVTYRILVPVLGPRPNAIVIFYDCNVMKAE